MNGFQAYAGGRLRFCFGIWLQRGPARLASCKQRGRQEKANPVEEFLAGASPHLFPPIQCTRIAENEITCSGKAATQARLFLKLRQLDYIEHPEECYKML